MQKHNLFCEYLHKVCEQIRWKKAHPLVIRELGDHLEDRQEALLGSGLTADAAAREAIRDMGDPLFIGSQLDRSYRPRPAWGVIGVTVALMALGFFARDYFALPSEDVAHRLFFMAAAVAVLIAGYFLDYTVLGKHPLAIGVGFAALVISLPFLNPTAVNGLPYNVYHFGVYIMALIPVVYAAILWWWPYKGYSGLIGCYAALFAFFFVCAVFSWGPLALLLYCGACGIMLTVEVLKGKFNIRKLGGLLVLYVPLALLSVYAFKGIPGFTRWVVRRLTVAFFPWKEPEGAGYMGVQLREILANAKWIGRGGYNTYSLPRAWEDFMLACYIHHFGWISLAVVLLLFGALLAFSIHSIKKQRSKLGRMAASAVLASLMLQVALYIFNNTSGFLSFSVLPLVSWGNAALLVNSFLIGLMLSVFRSNDIAYDPVIEPKRIPRLKITWERVDKNT